MGKTVVGGDQPVVSSEVYSGAVVSVQCAVCSTQSALCIVQCAVSKMQSAVGNLLYHSSPEPAQECVEEDAYER